ncbi:hypothetical protein HYW99_04410 [Candidatus Woesearchaeota archaeon]|nr:hypothetical protein [Candidatus Woesearchaeota archaeon]
MSFNDWWKKQNITKKFMYIGGLASVIFSFLVATIFMVIPSIMEDKLICGTLGGGGECGDIFSFLLFYIVYLFWSLVFIFIPSVAIGALVGFIISKFKKNK